MKQKIKSITPKPVWRFLSNSQKKYFRLKLILFVKISKNNILPLRCYFKKKTKNIIWLDTIEPVKTFRRSLSVDAFEPDYGQKNEFEVIKPRVNLYEFENATVHGESSHIILSDSVVMERLPHVPVNQCDYSTAFIKAHDSEFAIFGSKYERIVVDKGFFLGGNGSWNYYHWTLEIVAKLKYFLSLNIDPTDIKIILPNNAKNIKSFSVILEIFLENKYNFIFISRKQVAKVKKIYTITTPSNVVFNTSHGGVFKRNYFFYDKESIDFIRETVLSSSQYKYFIENISKKICSKKVYLARKSDAERSYNQYEVLNLVVEQGFKPVYLEELSFFQQVYLFQNADIVIGASGAAWTNIIYTKPGTKGVSWLGRNIKDFSCYSTLAKYYDSDLSFLLCEVDDESFNHSSYSVDLDALLDKLK